MNRLNKEGMRAVAHTISQLGWEDIDTFTFLLQLAKDQGYKLEKHQYDFYLNMCIYLSSDCHFMFDMMKIMSLQGKELADNDWLDRAIVFYKEDINPYKL